MKRVFVLLLSMSSGYLLAVSYVVTVPVADVFDLELEGKCRENMLNARSSHLCSRDSGGRDTQLLAGEVVEFVRDCGDGWFVVDVPGQEAFDSGHGQLFPIRGLVRQEYLSKVSARGPDAYTHMLLDNCLLVVDPGVESGGESLFFGTRVRLDGSVTKNGLAKISCAQGVISGWVPSKSLKPLGHLRTRSQASVRRDIVSFARKFLGAPYRWGGCSGYDASEKKIVTGVDCSGLVLRAYSSVGIELARNSSAQFVQSVPVLEGKDLLPGDCVFIARLIPETTTSRVYHVMIVTDKNTLIESTGSATGQPRSSVNDMSEEEIALSGCREIAAEDHPILKRPLHKIGHGQMINGRLVFLGRFLPASVNEGGSVSVASAQKVASAEIGMDSVWRSRRGNAKSKVVVCREELEGEGVTSFGLVDVQKVLPDIVADPLYAKECNFTSQVLYPGVNTCFIHKDLVPLLQQASDELSGHGYGLKMFDGYRPRRVQYIMFDLVPADGAAQGRRPGPMVLLQILRRVQITIAAWRLM